MTQTLFALPVVSGTPIRRLGLLLEDFEFRNEKRRRLHKQSGAVSFLLRPYCTVCVPTINTGRAPIVT